MGVFKQLTPEQKGQTIKFHIVNYFVKFLSNSHTYISSMAHTHINHHHHHHHSHPHTHASSMTHACTQIKNGTQISSIAHYTPRSRGYRNVIVMYICRAKITSYIYTKHQYRKELK